MIVAIIDRQWKDERGLRCRRCGSDRLRGRRRPWRRREGRERGRLPRQWLAKARRRFQRRRSVMNRRCRRRRGRAQQCAFRSSRLRLGGRRRFRQRHVEWPAALARFGLFRLRLCARRGGPVDAPWTLRRRFHRVIVILMVRRAQAGLRAAQFIAWLRHVNDARIAERGIGVRQRRRACGHEGRRRQHDGERLCQISASPTGGSDGRAMPRRGLARPAPAEWRPSRSVPSPVGRVRRKPGSSP